MHIEILKQQTGSHGNCKIVQFINFEVFQKNKKKRKSKRAKKSNIEGKIQIARESPD